jgi:hypothetical protein
MSHEQGDNYQDYEATKFGIQDDLNLTEKSGSLAHLEQHKI